MSARRALAPRSGERLDDPRRDVRDVQLLGACPLDQEAERGLAVDVGGGQGDSDRDPDGGGGCDLLAQTAARLVGQSARAGAVEGSPRVWAGGFVHGSPRSRPEDSQYPDAALRTSDSPQSVAEASGSAGTGAIRVVQLEPDRLAVTVVPVDSAASCELVSPARRRIATSKCPSSKRATR